MRDVGAPMTLGELGYGEDDVPALAEGAYKQQRLLVVSPRDGARRTSRRSCARRCRADISGPYRYGCARGRRQSRDAARLRRRGVPRRPGASRRSPRPATSARPSSPTSCSSATSPSRPAPTTSTSRPTCSGRPSGSRPSSGEPTSAVFCVNGSTQGNQALALAAARPGERVVVSRNLHKSDARRPRARRARAGLGAARRRCRDRARARPSRSSRIETRPGRACGRAGRLPRRAELRRRHERRRARSPGDRPRGGGTPDRRPGLGRLPRLPPGASAAFARRSAPTPW